MTTLCPLTEMQLNAMTDADARALDRFGGLHCETQPVLAVTAFKAAAELRCQREVRRQRARQWEQQP